MAGPCTSSSLYATMMNIEKTTGVVIANGNVYTPQYIKQYKFKVERGPVKVDANVSRAMALIPFLVVKTSKKGLVNSHMLTGLLTSLIGNIDTATVILVMAHLGFKPTFLTSASASCYCTFNCKFVESEAVPSPMMPSATGKYPLGEDYGSVETDSDSGATVGSLDTVCD